ncbi:MAG: succinate dehydrogenase, hydrophobic membrane anchor protein [Hydrogenophilales bacterium CG17_big_fil_post_rev_8_21_14_2_50_63_12]|nr:MAG: succinate dehydrogenase, hydrophobic membrane anchor protein [Hydrogenophilales bacterium CG17_big_fil_post_rev_8_21_14_2_50_63_12]PIX96311.1 MAG: succinate dehydrogenase, hydrophobic membrane anchor protein [Hydrogenophilales bacterium CG_4_10_14_3_um_filter_63_21]PJB06291.1 MAG: succinate dehydrogenase, hydrophobic membrane anchor protein [Hydrogenophilales bacterium CG_4_9_14_3_um_filter_63_34]
MRNASGARRGLNHWLLARASAAYMALFLPIFFVYACQGGLDYAAWRGLFLPVFVKVAVLLFAVALLAHAWIGLREIFIDYVHPLFLRLSLVFLFGVVYAACLIWAVAILWSLK